MGDPSTISQGSGEGIHWELLDKGDVFCRVANRNEEKPRYSLIGAKACFYSGLGYMGGHEKLDRIIEILDKRGVREGIVICNRPQVAILRPR
jgi:hypothetical protein